MAVATGCYTGVDADIPSADMQSSGISAGNDAASEDEGSDDGSTGEPGAGSCNADNVPRVWRLTARQYDRTLAALFAFDAGTSWSANFPADPESHFFSNNSDVLMVPPPLTLELARTAELIVEAVFADKATHLQHLWPCDLAELDTDAPSRTCVEQFVADVGKRIYRRPLTQDELAAYLQLVEDATTDRRGVELALEAMVQSPHFLYRTELTDGDGGLTPHEIVSFLAFTLWDVGPDDELLAIADAGLSEDDYDELITRVLDDERAAATYPRFFLDWLDLTQVHTLDKSADPRWSPALAQAMEQELVDYIDHVMREGDGTQAEIFASTTTVHDPNLDAIYGSLPVGPDGLVEHPEGQRAGLLTLPGWLATHAEPQRPTPIARGVFVRTRIMCEELPPIPGDVDPVVPPAEPGETTRERFARHTSDPVCAACHQLIDPVGFLFSNYDPLGTHITEEAGEKIDSSGVILGTQTLDGEYDNAVDFLDRLARSEELTGCVPEQMYKFVYGQPVDAREDECALEEITDDYAASEGDIRGLLHSMLGRRLAAGR